MRVLMGGSDYGPSLDPMERIGLFAGLALMGMASALARSRDDSAITESKGEMYERVAKIAFEIGAAMETEYKHVEHRLGESKHHSGV